MKKRTINLLMALVLLANAISLPAWAAERAETASAAETQTAERQEKTEAQSFTQEQEAEPKLEPWVIEETYYFDDFPVTESPQGEDLLSNWRYMMKNGQLSMTLTYKDLYFSSSGETSEWVRALCENLDYYFEAARGDYPEYASFYSGHGSGINYRWNGNRYGVTVTIYLITRGGLDEETLRQQIAFVDQACEDAILELRQQGRLRAEMTDKEKTLVFYKYVIHRFTYDLGYTGTSLYRDLTNDFAVCEGYACLFNALCHRVGIPTRMVTGTRGGGLHAWAEIEANGIRYWIDPTWGECSKFEDAYEQYRNSDFYFGLIEKGHLSLEQAEAVVVERAKAAAANFWDEEWQDCFNLSEFWVPYGC